MKTMLLMVSLILVGCSTTMNKDTMGDDSRYYSLQDWTEYGQQQGLKGEIKLSPVALNSKAVQMSEDVYAAYSQGYENGRQEYCQQSAYILGLKSMPYNGVCHDTWFALDWASGKDSGTRL